MRIGKSILATLALALIAAASLPAPVFFEAPLEPPAGRIISGWGEFSRGWNLGNAQGKRDAEDLAAYEKTVAPHAPAMISFDVAAGLHSGFGVLESLSRVRSGPWVLRRASCDRLSADFEHDVSIGMRDPDLMVLADGLHGVGRPVLVRVGPQFNQPGALYEPSSYIGAFRHATDIMRKAHMNSAMLWDAAAQGISTSQYMKWYPGDDVVDWWGIEVSATEDLAQSGHQGIRRRCGAPSQAGRAQRDDAWRKVGGCRGRMVWAHLRFHTGQPGSQGHKPAVAGCANGLMAHGRRVCETAARRPSIRR